jgi:2-polyprenyl-3-methyl-5-hydroxy-6-metoxy-1,4-benzoquinol methylase
MTHFSDKIVRILNHGALNLALGMGYTLKIFDVMDEMGSFVTLNTLAEATRLDRRYLKEWLGIMVTGEIITLSPGPCPTEKDLEKKGPQKKTLEETYYLPPAHADVLTRRAGNNNLGVYTQETPLLTVCAMEAVQKGFLTGEGVGFDQYPGFQRFMSELSNAKHEQMLIQTFLPSVENGALVEKLKQGISVCDMGCGQGVALNLMAKAFPNSQFLGVDNHGGAILRARESAKEMNLFNARFKVLDAAQIKKDSRFFQKYDYVTAFDAIHDQSHPLTVLEGIRAMLKPGGLFSMVDIKASSRLQDNIDHPMAPFLYTVSLMHCMPVGLNDKGRGLGMMWGKEQALTLLARAGFDRVDAHEIPDDPFNLHFLSRILTQTQKELKS